MGVLSLHLPVNISIISQLYFNSLSQKFMMQADGLVVQNVQLWVENYPCLSAMC